MITSFRFFTSLFTSFPHFSSTFLHQQSPPRLAPRIAPPPPLSETPQRLAAERTRQAQRVGPGQAGRQLGEGVRRGAGARALGLLWVAEHGAERGGGSKERDGYWPWWTPKSYNSGSCMVILKATQIYIRFCGDQPGHPGPGEFPGVYSIRAKQTFLDRSKVHNTLRGCHGSFILVQ